MKATLTTLTPVHIGNGTTYNKNIDFIQSGKKIGVIDEEKVLKILGTENLHQWVSAINRGGHDFINLLKQRGWREDDLESISVRVDNLKTPDNQSNELKEAYRSPLKGLSIPGSSIKGAMRTAILNHLLTEDVFKQLKPEDLKIQKEKWNNHSGRKERYDVWTDSKIEKKLFGENANEKSTRFLKVRDAYFENTQPDVYELRLLDSFYEYWAFKEGQQSLIETIPAGIKTETDIIIDEKMLSENIKQYKNKWPDNKIAYLKKGMNGLCRIVTEFTKQCCGYDYNHLYDEQIDEGHEILEQLDKIYNTCENAAENEMIFRVGGHSGYLFTTGQWISMSNESILLPQDDFNALRRNIQRNKDYSDMEIWPKTRKIASNGQIFGFVKISFS